MPIVSWLMAYGLWPMAYGLWGKVLGASFPLLSDENEIGEGFGNDVCITSIDDGVL